MKKHFFIFSITALFLLSLIFVLIKVAPIVIGGYDLYKEAVMNQSLEDKITEIKNDENYISIDEVSPEFLDLIIQSEDHRFYSHNGIDLLATTRAMYHNLKAHAFVQGGSTITQQLAKNLYFSFEKRYERKIAELFVAFDLEKLLTKQDILELYCNVIYFGEGCYGLNEATEHYYNISPNQLSTSQSVALIKTIKSPNHYNPNALAN